MALSPEIIAARTRLFDAICDLGEGERHDVVIPVAMTWFAALLCFRGNDLATTLKLVDDLVPGIKTDIRDYFETHPEQDVGGHG